jgi:hypothetical protein
VLRDKSVALRCRINGCLLVARPGAIRRSFCERNSGGWYKAFDGTYAVIGEADLSREVSLSSPMIGDDKGVSRY